MNVRPTLAMSSIAIGGVGLFAIALLASQRLTPQELGYFYSFMSFGMLLQLSDFGLSYATLVTAGKLAGSGSKSVIPALGRFITRWNVFVSVIAMLVVGIIGGTTFSKAAQIQSSVIVEWRGPWYAYLLSMLVVQLGVPGMSLREGSGKVAQMWRLRLAQELSGAMACLISLYLGTGLWSLAAYSTARALVVGVWLRFVDPFSIIPGSPQFPARRWLEESWPFQWKIGLSFISGFLIFRAFSPIILYVKGPVPAGQIGLSVAIMNLLISITGAWPLSQTARYTSLLADRRFHEFDSELPPLVLRSTALSIAAVASLWTVLWLAREHGVLFAARLTDPATTAVILASAIVHHVINCIAVFLRAEGREPLVVPSISGGIATVLVVWAVARVGTLMEVAISYLALSLIGIPIAVLTYRSRKTTRKNLNIN